MGRKERVREKINAEFQRFRKEMLVLPQMVLFDKCKQIWFYCCIQEYFQTNEELSEEILELAESESFSIRTAWWFYIRNEYSRCETWKEVNTMLLEMYRSGKRRGVK